MARLIGEPSDTNLAGNRESAMARDYVALAIIKRETANVKPEHSFKAFINYINFSTPSVIAKKASSLKEALIF